jgi:hypothetical protein
MEWWIALVVVLAVVWVLSRRAARRRLAPMPVTPQLIPHSYDLDNPDHVVRIDEIREAYANLLSHDESEFADCTFKPASLLPYPKRDVAEALSAILDYAEGRTSSKHFDPIIRQPTVVTTLHAALVQLETFLDVPPGKIPREPRANIEFGLRHRHRVSENDE